MPLYSGITKAENVIASCPKVDNYLLDDMKTVSEYHDDEKRGMLLPLAMHFSQVMTHSRKILCMRDLIMVGHSLFPTAYSKYLTVKYSIGEYTFL